MGGPRVGLYLRLSREDEGAGESMSIENQRAYLLDYAAGRGWTVAQIYQDDGWTGTNFRRPGFQALLADIEAGRIDLVLTKDLSRLGRDQAGTVYYYQCYFPAHGVRYVAAAEGFDTAAGQSAIALPFLAAANDFYTADISRKVRAALDTRRKGGLFIGAAPPLGYRKDPDRKGHLLPDPNTAWVAQAVFSTYLTRTSVRGTARALTESGVPTPAQCKGRPPGVWSDTMVRRVLTNPTYAGHLTQNRSEKAGYKVDRRRYHRPEDWTVVPNTHTPLISQADFDRVQALLAVRSYTPKSGPPHRLTGLVFCGDCHSPMAYVKEGKKLYLVCRRSRTNGGCTSHRMAEDKILSALKKELDRLTAGVVLPAPAPAQEDMKTRRALEGELRLLRQAGAALYRDRVAEVLEPEEFAALLEAHRAAVRQVEGRLAALIPPAAPPPSLPDLLSRPALLALVERIEIGAGGSLTLSFRFRDPHFCHTSRGGL